MGETGLGLLLLILMLMDFDIVVKKYVFQVWQIANIPKFIQCFPEFGVGRV